MPVNKAVRMGDYLRYALFDKYFKKMGCHQSRRHRLAGVATVLTSCCRGTTPGAAPPIRRPAGPSASAAATITRAIRTRWPHGC